MLITTSNGASYFYLRVRSNQQNAEKISLRVYDTVSKEEMTVSTSIDFAAQGVLGYPSTPFSLSVLPYCTITTTVLGHGSVTGAGEYVYGSDVTLTATPESNYHFVKWSNDEITNPYTFKANKSISLSALFEGDVYSVKYYVDDSLVHTENIAYGDAITPLPQPTQEGFTFSGWSEIPATMPAHDVEINGTFFVNSYTITYYVDEELYATETHEFGETIVPLEEPTKENYDFSGWSDLPTTMPARDIKVEGYFSIASGIISIVDDDKVLYTIYDIKGHLLKHKVLKKEIDNLPQGLYIINGRKYCTHLL